MAPAKYALESALKDTPVSMPRIPIVSNVTARPYTSPQDVKELLQRQLVEPVHWEQTIEWLSQTESVHKFIDAGPGQQLKAMNRRIDKKIFGDTSALDV